MILDANLLLYARNSADPRHERAAAVVQETLNGPRRVGLPWQSLTAFLRIATHPRVFPCPLTAAAAAEQVVDDLADPGAAAEPHLLHGGCHILRQRDRRTHATSLAS